MKKLIAKGIRLRSFASDSYGIIQSVSLNIDYSQYTKAQLLKITGSSGSIYITHINTADPGSYTLVIKNFNNDPHGLFAGGDEM